ncbi:hypothetical protein N865_00395 [Intrasporangium oryzae NRRL B-24470]|uniref:Uncharacterized protein n=1 Tax=Intrasporangium oryzae NRRL B-24470 TaxID=1386089 RepID=W9G7P8_9MICO|nr:hypothetical protein N865_00395 [Intrasporangium oryzae NRRL B-24470]
MVETLRADASDDGLAAAQEAYLAELADDVSMSLHERLHVGYAVCPARDEWPGSAVTWREGRGLRPTPGLLMAASPSCPPDEKRVARGGHRMSG